MEIIVFYNYKSLICWPLFWSF